VLLRRESISRIDVNDPRIREKLTRSGLTMRYRPKKGEHIALLDVANVMSGGDAVDVTNRVHSQFVSLLVKLVRDVGLRLCSIDLAVNGDIGQGPSDFWVLEVNSAPGLGHFVEGTSLEKELVTKLYLRVIQDLQQ
jgi:D-alanine-D-alanine ligase-like ATP-grasp enzyme